MCVCVFFFTHLGAYYLNLKSRILNLESLGFAGAFVGSMWAENVFLWQRRSIYYLMFFAFVYVISE